MTGNLMKINKLPYKHVSSIFLIFEVRSIRPGCIIPIPTQIFPLISMQTYSLIKMKHNGNIMEQLFIKAYGICYLHASHGVLICQSMTLK